MVNYWETSDIVDLTYDEMAAEIESYIKFCENLRDEYPESKTDGIARMGFLLKSGDRWELIAFNPELDDVYTTTDVVDKIVDKYPDVFSESGRKLKPGRKQ